MDRFTTWTTQAGHSQTTTEKHPTSSADPLAWRNCSATEKRHYFSGGLAQANMPSTSVFARVSWP